MHFVDTETCGLHGIIVLIQYAEDDGPITLYSPWLEPIKVTLELIEDLFKHDLCGFNWAFDQFHLTKLYNVLRLTGETYGFDKKPISMINEIALLEPKARNNALCLKPRGIVDLMLHARKGPYQSTMDRKSIRVKKVPVELGKFLAEELNKRIEIKDIYFERSKEKKKWHIRDRKDADGKLDLKFQDVILKFAPSSALKALAVDALGLDVQIKYENLDVTHPRGLGYAPFALAGYKTIEGKYVKPKVIKLPSGDVYYDWKQTWPRYVEDHVRMWEFNDQARKYAHDDIVYTRELYNFFKRTANEDLQLVVSDDDSELACMVGNVRWHGFAINKAKIKALIKESVDSRGRIPTDPRRALKYLHDVMEPTEALIVDSTRGKLLEHVATWSNDDSSPHPAALRAQEIIDARGAEKEIDLYNKLLRAGRFHASFKVIGSLSTRMSGADELNPQGINRERKVRECFQLAFNKRYQLDGGDFDSFEVGLMDAAYHDSKMHAELTSGLKIHSIWGSRYFFPHLSYDEICATKGTKQDLYSRSKNGVFAVCYFGETHTLVTRVGLPEDVAEEAYRRILEDYPEFCEARRDVVDMFCSMKQPGGIGTAVEWHEPADYIASMLMFRRYFTLENRICRALFDMAQKPPEPWKKLRLTVVRSDREQTACGALQSALYGAAFQIQGSNMRAAGNHRIQSTGAQITKAVQRGIWDHQPQGAHPFVTLPLNIHDEIMCVNKRTASAAIAETVRLKVESYRPIVPLIGMEWKTNMTSWGEK
jgi:hypothetical protein